MENNPVDAVNSSDVSTNTEDRTIQMDSIKDFNTGDVPSYTETDEPETVSDITDSSDEAKPSDSDEVTEEEYQEYIAEKKERAKKIKAKNRHIRTFSHILTGVLLSVFIISVSSSSNNGGGSTSVPPI